MDSKVRLKTSKTGKVIETTFEHAQNILRIDKNNDFEIADKKKFQFINNDLIKRPSPKGGRKSTKQGADNKRGEIPK
jgi:hypothetical protein